MNSLSDCVFCRIVNKQEPTSIIYEDDIGLAFMGIRPIHPGESIVIPKVHVDHFTDVEDETARHLIVIAQRLGRRIREVFQPLRVGMLVHGFGVAHAHIVVVPQHHADDITSSHFASLVNGRIVFNSKHAAKADRVELDKQARLLAI